MALLSLVGAGPGDPELITLKALNAIKGADVVLYDALASIELLDYCKPGCQKVYVGKKPGIHQYQQIYINDMIVSYARKYERVVRLKGGDPFIFGRGHEELEHARTHGIEVEIIPGISSSTSVPALSGIPLTKRGVNESFWVITGTTRSLDLSGDLYLAAQSSATIIVLMGMKQLPKIVSLFKQVRGKDEAIAIIQNGSRADEVAVASTLEDIEENIQANKMTSPAIIVIGEVVRYGDLELLQNKVFAELRNR